MINKNTLDEKALSEIEELVTDELTVAMYHEMSRRHQEIYAENCQLKARLAAITAYLQAVKPAESEVDWPEDFSHENGNYQNQCHKCATIFTGYKRRVTCKKCAAMQPKLSGDIVKQGVAIIKEEFLNYKQPSIELPADSVIENCVNRILAMQPKPPSDAGLLQIIQSALIELTELREMAGNTQWLDEVIGQCRKALKDSDKQALTNPAPDNEHKELLERVSLWEETQANKTPLYGRLLIRDLAAALTTKE